MRTVKQVSVLTGVSVRTLQFYDEIGLLKPAQITGAGYRLYDDKALERLQQILFLKELDFTLKEIRGMLDHPQFDRAAALKKQRELIALKRDRLDRLLELLDKLMKGEQCMDFKDFDLSEYFRALAAFKETHPEAIEKRMGTLERFDEMLLDLKSREDEIAALAVKEYGSIETFTEAMEKNLRRFLEDGPTIAPKEASGLIEKTELLTRRLTADLSRDASSPEVQEMVGELIAFVDECNRGIEMGENYWGILAGAYLENPSYIEVTNRKYGQGASRLIGLAIR